MGSLVLSGVKVGVELCADRGAVRNISGIMMMMASSVQISGPPHCVVKWLLMSVGPVMTSVGLLVGMLCSVVLMMILGMLMVCVQECRKFWVQTGVLSVVRLLCLTRLTVESGTCVVVVSVLCASLWDLCVVCKCVLIGLGRVADMVLGLVALLAAVMLDGVLVLLCWVILLVGGNMLVTGVDLLRLGLDLVGTLVLALVRFLTCVLMTLDDGLVDC